MFRKKLEENIKCHANFKPACLEIIANGFLKNKTCGEYLLRYDAKHQSYVVSFKNKSNDIKHFLIIKTQTEPSLWTIRDPLSPEKVEYSGSSLYELLNSLETKNQSISREAEDKLEQETDAAAEVLKNLGIP